MHELSLALEVCRLVEQNVEPGAAPRLRTVAVEVGDQANIEIENFRFCLEALLGAPPFARATPALIVQPGSDLRLAYLEVDDDSPDH